MFVTVLSDWYDFSFMNVVILVYLSFYKILAMVIELSRTKKDD